MDEVFIKREIEKTKKYIEINKYSKEDAIGFIKAKMEIAEHTGDEAILNSCKMLLEEYTNKD